LPGGFLCYLVTPSAAGGQMATSWQIVIFVMIVLAPHLMYHEANIRRVQEGDRL
jgi:hypothetical protein